MQELLTYFLMCYTTFNLIGCKIEEEEKKYADFTFDGPITYNSDKNTLTFSIKNIGNGTADADMGERAIISEQYKHSHTIFKLVNSETKKTPIGNQKGDALSLVEWMAPWSQTFPFGTIDMEPGESMDFDIDINGTNNNKSPEAGEYWIILDFLNNEKNEIDELGSIGIAGQVFEDIVMLSDIDNIDSNNIGKFVVPAAADQ